MPNRKLHVFKPVRRFFWFMVGIEEFLRHDKAYMVFFYPCFISFMDLLGLKFIGSDKLKAKQTQ